MFRQEKSSGIRLFVLSVVVLGVCGFVETAPGERTERDPKFWDWANSAMVRSPKNVKKQGTGLTNCEPRMHDKTEQAKPDTSRRRSLVRALLMREMEHKATGGAGSSGQRPKASENTIHVRTSLAAKRVNSGENPQVGYESLGQEQVHETSQKTTDHEVSSGDNSSNSNGHATQAGNADSTDVSDSDTWFKQPWFYGACVVAVNDFKGRYQ